MTPRGKLKIGRDDIIDDAIEEILQHTDSLIDGLPEHLQKEVLECVRNELSCLAGSYRG